MPEQRIVPDGDVWQIITEPEWDKDQYELMVALHEHEASLGEHGFPLDETMTVDADPLNPNRTHEFVVRPARDWLDHAMEEAQKDPRYSGENYSQARKWIPHKIER